VNRSWRPLGGCFVVAVVLVILVPKLASAAADAVRSPKAPFAIAYVALVAAGVWWLRRRPRNAAPRVVVRHRPATTDGSLRTIRVEIHPAGPGWAPPVLETARPLTREQRVLDLAAAGKWDRVVDLGAVSVVGLPVVDPGNPGQIKALLRDNWGTFTVRGARLLLAVNGTVNADGTRNTYAIPVPDDVPDPLTADAWTYNDDEHPVKVTAQVIAEVARRT
jgi:hypothetical protein